MSGPIELADLETQISELYRPAPRGHWQRRVQTLLCEWLDRDDVRVCWSEAEAEGDGSPVRVPLPGRVAPPTFIGFGGVLEREERRLAQQLLNHVALAAQLMESMTELPDQPIPPRWRQVLTPRQAEVANLAANGLRDKEIAEQLGIAPRTVARLMQEVFKRLDLNSRHELAAEMALGRPPTPIGRRPRQTRLGDSPR